MDRVVKSSSSFRKKKKKKKKNIILFFHQSYSIGYFSKGKSKALFLRHEVYTTRLLFFFFSCERHFLFHLFSLFMQGYLGSLGAFLYDTNSAVNPWFQRFKNDLMVLGEVLFLCVSSFLFSFFILFYFPLFLFLLDDGFFSWRRCLTRWHPCRQQQQQQQQQQ